MFCCDGIFWTSRLILASLTSHLRDSLSEDACLILPDVQREEFAAFHSSLFRRDVQSPEQMRRCAAIAMLLGIRTLPTPAQSRLQPPASSSASMNTMNYVKILRNHREEYIKKVVGNTDVVKQVINTVQKKTRPPKISDILGDVLEDSYNKHRDRLQCSDCPRQFEDEDMLRTHRDIVHSESSKPLSKPFSCQFCSKQFSFKVNVRRHVYLVHPDSEARAERGEAGDDTGDVSGDGEYKENALSQAESFPRLEQFQCRICGKFLKSKRYLVAHIQEHYGGGYR